MKKLILFLLLVSYLGFNLFPTVVFAAPTDIDFDNPIGGESEEITDFFENAMVKLGSIIAYLAVTALVISGIMYIIAGAGGGNENMKKLSQNTMVFAIIGLALAAAGPTFLQQIKIIVLGEGANMPTNIGEAPTIAEIVRRLITFLLSIVGILAIISLIIGGMMYVMAGTVDVVQRATKTIIYSIIGIIITGTALVIVDKVVRLMSYVPGQ